MDPDSLLALYISNIMGELGDLQGEIDPQVPSVATVNSFNDFYEAMLAKGDTMEADVIKDLWMDPSFASPYIKQLSDEEIVAIAPGSRAFTKRDERGVDWSNREKAIAEFPTFMPEGGWVDTLGVNPGDFHDFVSEYPHALATASFGAEERENQGVMAMFQEALFGHERYGYGPGTTLLATEGRKEYKTDKDEWMYPTWINAPESLSGYTMPTGDWKVYEKGQESLPLTYGDAGSAGYPEGDRPPLEAWAHERIEPVLNKLMYANMVEKLAEDDPEILESYRSNFLDYILDGNFSYPHRPLTPK